MVQGSLGAFPGESLNGNGLLPRVGRTESAGTQEERNTVFSNV